MNTQTTKKENFHVFKIVYMGCTNTKPARYKIISERFRKSKVYSYGAHENFNQSIEYVINTLQNLGFEIIGKAEGKDCDYIISSTFKNLI